MSTVKRSGAWSFEADPDVAQGFWQALTSTQKSRLKRLLSVYVTVLPAAGVIGEAWWRWLLADAMRENLVAILKEMKRNYNGYRTVKGI